MSVVTEGWLEREVWVRWSLSRSFEEKSRVSNWGGLSSDFQDHLLFTPKNERPRDREFDLHVMTCKTFI